jgi:hypothetical protein
MAQDPIRRSQLISPHGVGSLLVVKGGVSVMACGLDYWYQRESQDNSAINLDEFDVEEYRLEKLLKVSHFRLPPDYRTPVRGRNIPNTGLGIPFVRFPQWHVCTWCHRMEKLRLFDREVRIKCRECSSSGRFGYLQQAIFVAMCEQGHLQDFPWREWVHRSSKPTCERPLRYMTSGGAGLASQRVKCDCLAERTMAGITTADPDGTTFLSKTLDAEEVFLCQGHRPWLGKTTDEPCRFHIRGSLRGAMNVWFGKVYSSIYLPQTSELAPSELISLLKTPRIASTISILTPLVDGSIADRLRGIYAAEIGSFSDDQIDSAIRIIRGETVDDGDDTGGADDDGTAFRRAEYNVLKEDSKEDLLIINSVPMERYDPGASKYFSRIGLVSRLRETRVFAGFSRIVSDKEVPLEDRKQMLWDRLPAHDESWLPASVVYGEGLFLELDEELLRSWETTNKPALSQHLKTLRENFDQVRVKRGLPPKEITPRFILLHTFAHVLINRLTFECGYASASLRERIYVSDSPSNPMAGVLIYTANGDSDGTMGGLVRMGNPGYFESLFRRALEAAEWCSVDPVCRELGARGGQGPDSCNLAACHSCSLLPETSCEEFNRFLDRSLLVKSVYGPDIAFFETE